MAKMRFDLTNKRFGMLVALHLVEDSWQAEWLCKCDCGKTRVCRSVALRADRVFSCGCTKRCGTHRHSWEGGCTVTYRSWKSMIARCFQPSNPAFAYYQERGVTVCKRWRKFENFLADMGERPSLGHSLDRWPDNGGDYKPGNCRWATKQEQANNRITNIRFEYLGKSMTFADLVRVTGLPKELLRYRILRKGMDVEAAIVAVRSIAQG